MFTMFEFLLRNLFCYSMLFRKFSQFCRALLVSVASCSLFFTRTLHFRFRIFAIFVLLIFFRVFHRWHVEVEIWCWRTIVATVWVWLSSISESWPWVLMPTELSTCTLRRGNVDRSVLTSSRLTGFWEIWLSIVVPSAVNDELEELMSTHESLTE